MLKTGRLNLTMWLPLVESCHERCGVMLSRKKHILWDSPTLVCILLIFTKTLVSLLKHVPLTIRPLSITRWEARIDDLVSLRYQLADVHDALLDIYEDESLTGIEGTKQRTEAQGLSANLACYKFIASLVIWFDILFQTNIVHRYLQKVGLDLSSHTYSHKNRSSNLNKLEK